MTRRLLLDTGKTPGWSGATHDWQPSAGQHFVGRSSPPRVARGHVLPVVKRRSKQSLMRRVIHRRWRKVEKYGGPSESADHATKNYNPACPFGGWSQTQPVQVREVIGVNPPYVVSEARRLLFHKSAEFRYRAGQHGNDPNPGQCEGDTLRKAGERT